MASIEEKQNQIVEEFSLLPEWLDRYEQIIDLGQALEPLPASLRTEAHLIKGCQSRVWIAPVRHDDGTLFFYADSDAVITKGIAALILRAVNGHTPDEIASCQLFMIERLGLEQNLSRTRANGLVAMVDSIRAYASAASTSL